MATQREQVIQAMLKNGGYANFGQLNQLIDFSNWKTKTPQASVRRIVQVSSDFFKIRPGLWALKEFETEVLKKLNFEPQNKKRIDDFTHSYYQGLIVEIGNMKRYQTYVSVQDKNKLFLEKPLKEISNLDKIYNFTYPEILGKAKSVDVVWFNERRLPHSFFEVEHSTNIRNSLNRFFELQDYHSRFFIVADKSRKKLFQSLLSESIFYPIKNRVQFADYEDIEKQHTNMSKTTYVI